MSAEVSELDEGASVGSVLVMATPDAALGSWTDVRIAVFDGDVKVAETGATIEVTALRPGSLDPSFGNGGLTLRTVKVRSRG